MSAVEKKIYSAFGILNLKSVLSIHLLEGLHILRDMKTSHILYLSGACRTDIPETMYFNFSGAGDNERSQSTDQKGKLMSKNDLQVHT